MKKLSLLILLVFSLKSYCQKNSIPTFYMDSLEVDMDYTYINPKSIESIDIGRKSENGEVHFSAKKSLVLNSISEVLKKQTLIPGLNKTTIIKINGKKIINPSDLKIDDSYFFYFNLETFTDVEYVSKKLRKIKILNIELEKEERKPQIIRGKGSNNVLQNLDQ